MKKYLFVLLTFALVMCMSSCTKEEEAKESDGSPSQYGGSQGVSALSF